MKKVFICGLVFFIIMAMTLPFIIEALYKIGETHPFIHTFYAPTDILNYIITIVGLLISFVALYFSLLQFFPTIKVKRWSVIGDDNKICEVIEIANIGANAITVQNIGLCSVHKKKRQRRMRSALSDWPQGLPMRIDNGNSYRFVLGDEQLIKKKITEFADDLKSNGFNNKKVAYYISLSTGATIIYRSKSDEIFLSQNSLS